MKHVMENKQTIAVMYQEKSKAWEEIQQKYNEKHPLNKRTAEQLSSKYDNLKTTGGGPPRHSDNPILEALLEIINKQSVYRENNKFDVDLLDIPQSDTIEVSFDQACLNNEPMVFTIDSQKNVIQFIEDMQEPVNK